MSTALAFHIPFAEQSLVLGIFLLFVLVVVAATAFWIWMLVDLLSSNRPTDQKLLWGLVILLTHLLGAVIYFAVERPKSSGTPRV